ncbi:AGE family epimerase/isomerase [Sediminitomix flava]|uniref:N-acylglucosamine 2-epimerase n=1 Tax=Sediminitomix flava TaxID=379075 RepID=A0A315ZEP4_SEDFL|nr:AGE family epimerase/isomerase [Sediminitomix flava]PWJ43802.1 N-acylglucosamine 2-epimerase [Sediminitomix flava]
MKDLTKITEYKELYKATLLDNVMPFWLENSIDQEFGGYFSCLDRDGTVYDTDKFMWLQNRELWMFSRMYNTVEAKEEWKEAATVGYEFLKKHGMDAYGNWYFSLNREGKPLVQPYNIFSDCFAAIGFKEYAVMTGDEEALAIAKRTFENILKRQANPKGSYNKIVDGTRPLKNFALPMILSNMALLFEGVLEDEKVNELVDQVVDEVMNVFLDEEKGIVYENVLPDGSKADCYDGRLLNPGHGIEAMWFIMDIAAKKSDSALMQKAVDVVISTLEYSWDKEFGGIFYFMDAEGRPPLQLEWDQKLWWVHLETLIALSKGFLHTEDQRCWDWYEKVHNYAWSHFHDPEFGEWFGYLNRRGEAYQSLKGSKWKGCYHVPRAMMECWQIFEKIEEKNLQLQ